jgi:hypothetical protein
MRAARPRSRFSAATLWTLAGFLVWALHFGVIYSLAALACARGFADARLAGIRLLSWGIGLATAAGFATTAAVIVLTWRDRRRHLQAEDDEDPTRFAAWLTVAIGLLASLAMLWQALAVLTVPACR